jgi:CheY-like chemotaxis protein
MADRFILLVEDSPDDAALTLRAFERSDAAHVDIEIARDGVEALDFLFATGAHAGHDPKRMPVFVLLDLKLPKMDGLEVVRRLRADARTALLPVVIFSSSNETHDIRAAWQSGASSYVCKPVEFGKFRETVCDLAHYWLNVNQISDELDRRL